MNGPHDDYAALVNMILGLFFWAAAVALVVVYQLQQIRRQLVASNQGLNDLNAAVAADTAEVQAEQASFTALEAAINALSTQTGGPTDAQLETLAQALQTAQAARAALVTQANASIPPAPVSTDAAKAK